MKQKSKFLTFVSHFRMYLGLAKAQFLVLPVFMLFSGIFDGLGIALFFPLLDRLHMNGYQAAESPFLSTFNRFLGALHIQSLQAVLAFIILVFFLKFIVNFFQEYAIQRIMRELYHDISTRIIKGWQEADYQGLYLNTTTGYFTNILTSSIWTFLGAFRYYCFTLVNLFYIGVYLVLSFCLDTRITLIAFASGIAVLYLLKYFTEMTARYSVKFTAENVVFSGRLVEFMQFYKYLKSTFQFPRMGANLDTSVRKIIGYQFYIGMISNFLAMVVEPVAVLLVVILLYLQIVVWRRDFGTIAVLILLFYRILRSIIGLQGGWQKYFCSIGGINMVQEALARSQSHKERPGGRKIGLFSDSLLLENVDFKYGDTQVLFNVGLKFPRNKTIALVGPSGAGKSTVVDLITGVLRPSAGRVSIDGIGYEEVDLASLRGIIGYVIQENVMFNDTIYNNITLWEEAADRGLQKKRVAEACRKAYCDRFIEALPRQYDTLVGDRGIKLSVGQRQRIAIARELYRNAQILILDEATSSLDTESENYIKQSIEDLKGTRTLIIIAHRLSTIKNADYVYVIDSGRIKEEGTFQELFENKDTQFYRMCQLQSF